MAEEIKKEEATAKKKAAAPKKAKAPAPETAAPKEEAVVEEKAAPKKAKKADKKPAKPVDKKEARKAAKKAAKAEIKVTEARCTALNVRVTPRKVRLVCDVVRGKSVEEALGLLSMLNKAASTPVAKAIKSAAANATNNFGMDKERLYVAEIQASDGLRIKRYTPRAKGSASPLIRRNTNLRVVVKERE
ncbi:MAG: 50S ribosomal protein L22 [Bacilli bacterium]|nr:50S ribosomal protein L22 [Bacilli bacterium]